MEGTEENAPLDIFTLAKETNTLTEESTEQQEESSTEEGTTNSTEENADMTSSETQDAAKSTEEEGETEASTEEDSDDSGIVDLNVEEEQSSNEQEESETTSETDTNFGEILNGQFSDEEDLISYLEEQDQTIAELKEGKTEFANDYVKRLNDHVLAGKSAESFTRVQGVDVNTMNPVEILTTELMWNNPELSEADAKSYLERKFPDSLDEEGRLDPKDAFLKVDAGKAAKSIKEIQAEDTLVPQNGMTEDDWNTKNEASQNESQEERDRQTTERMEGWMKPVEDELNSLKENGLIVPLTDSKGFKFAFDKDEAYENDLIGRVDKALMNMGSSVSESPKAAKGIMEMFFIVDNWKEMAKAASVKGANSKNEEWFKKVHNPSTISKGDERSTTTTEVTGADFMKGMMG